MSDIPADYLWVLLGVALTGTAAVTAARILARLPEILHAFGAAP